MKEVIIIGGGIAGLTTAHVLLNKNYTHANPMPTPC